MAASQSQTSRTMLNSDWTTRHIKVVLFGERQSGKTFFTDMFNHGRHYASYDPTRTGAYRNIDHHYVPHPIDIIDLNSTILYDQDPTLNPEYFKRKIQEADGVVLLYDITEPASFENITNRAYQYLWACKTIRDTDHPQPVRQSFACTLVGSKRDLIEKDAAKRRVDDEEAEQWAQSQGMRHFEVDSHKRTETEAVLTALLKDIMKTRELDRLYREESDREAETESRAPDTVQEETSQPHTLKRASKNKWKVALSKLKIRS